MRLLEALKVRRYLIVAIISALTIGLLLPIVQTGFLLNNLDLWFLTIAAKPLDAVLYVIFSAVFGILIAVQLWNRKVCSTCDISSGSLPAGTKKGSATGVFGAFFGFLLGICPACVGLIGLIAPLSVSIILTAYSSALTALSIAIMLLAIYLMGGFKKQ